MKKEKFSYAELINCKTPEEVFESVKQWYSDISDKNHIIRSIIIDLHTNIEFTMKQILYQYMIPLVIQLNGEEEKHVKQKKLLEKTITRMSFMNVYRLLKPCFDAYPAPEFSDIELINNVRNQLAHGDLKRVFYKERNPFNDHDCLAQLFFDSWAINKVLSKFYSKMIEDPRAEAKDFAKYYYKHKFPGLLNESKEKDKE